MNKLLKADFAMLFKSKIFYSFLAGFAALSLFPNILTCISEADNLKNVPFDPFGKIAFFIPLFSAVFAGFLISPQFDYGTVRNKLVIGHKRSELYLADTIVTIVAVMMFFAVYEIISFAFGLCLFDTSAFTAKILAQQFGFLAVLFIGNVLVSVSLCFIIKGNKSTVLAFMFQYLLMFGVVFQEFDGTLKKVGDTVMRFSPLGLTLTNKMPEKYWLNIICVGLLGLLMTALSMWDFKKCDLK